MAKKKVIRLGSGKLYIMEFDGSAIPEDAVIETEENLLGSIQGGANVEYSAEFYTATSDLGDAKKTTPTAEEVKLKSGIMTWNAETLQKLCSTARVTEDTAKGKRIVKIGGIGNQDGKIYLIRFYHEDKKDGDLRVTIVGKNGAGFSLAFAKDKETVIDAEFVAEPLDDEGTLLIYCEDIPKEAAPTPDPAPAAGSEGK